jgi:transcription initiation factor TFIIE subunit alpha
VRLAARAFYDDVSMKGNSQPKTYHGNNCGMAVVILDALTRNRMRTIFLLNRLSSQ